METNTAATRVPTIPGTSPAGFAGWLGAALILVVGGAFVGLGTALVGAFFYLVILFPVGMGFAGGMLVTWAVRSAHLRTAFQVLAVSLLAAAAIYGTFHYARYIGFQLSTMQALSEKVAESGSDAAGKVDLAVTRVFVNYALKEETGFGGFPGYMLYKARNGVSIGKFYSQNRTELTSWLAWLYWVLEFGVIAWIARSMGNAELKVPVCEACGRRFNHEQHLGGTAPANESLLLDLLRRSDVVELGRLMEKDAGLPSVELYMKRCEACDKSSAQITVRRATLTTKGVALAEISKATLRPQDGALFLQQLSYKPD
jgi:hypothetical protein